MSLEPRSSKASQDVERANSASIASSEQFAVAIVACRDVLLEASAEAPNPAMREAIATLAGMARRGGIPPERLLAELKDVLARLPQFEAQNVVARDDMVRDLVTCAIQSYFAQRAD